MIAINKDQLIREIKSHAERMDNKRNTATNYAYQLAHTHIIELTQNDTLLLTINVMLRVLLYEYLIVHSDTP